MPTKAQFQTVIDGLKSILPLAATEENFDMFSGTTICNGQVCGTVHCIGGWYAISKIKTNPNLDIALRGNVSFTHGADLMAKDLGFANHHEYEDWADANELLWGNAYGCMMFCGESAYNDAETLAQAIAHLESVRDRLPI